MFVGDRSTPNGARAAKCVVKWQWKSQFPGRSGTHVMEAVVPGFTLSVTTMSRSDVAYVVSRMPSPRLSTRK